MRIIDLLFKQRPNEGEKPLFPGWRYTPFGFSMWAGDNVSDYIKKGFAGNSTVYSIITACSRKFGSVPWFLYEVKDGKSVKRYDAMTRSYSDGLLNRYREKQQVMKEVYDTGFDKLMEQPNGAQSGSEFREQMYAFKMMTGAAPVYMNTGVAGTKPLAMYMLSPEFVRLYPDDSLSYIAKVSYDLIGHSYPIDVERLVYWKYHNPMFDTQGGHLYGLSPLRAALLNLSADNYSVQAMNSLYENKGASGVFVPVDKPVASGTQADILRKDLDELLSGPTNRGRMPYVNKQLQYVTYGMSAQELQLLEARRLGKEDFCNIYNYPIVLMVASQSTDNNLKHSVKYVLTNTIYADLVSWRDTVNRFILPKFFGKEQAKRFYWDFDISAMPEMADDTNRIVEYLRDAWWLTPNERRAAMHYEDMESEEMNEIYIPQAIVPIDMAGGVGDLTNTDMYEDTVTEPNGSAPTRRDQQERGQ